jgi:3-phosphoshikimate 1-carboxyvinyltransferase
MTLDTLKSIGDSVEVLENEYIVKPQKLISPETVAVEGDWSQAAFWVVANKICGNIEISGMNENSRQGDKKITEILDDTEIDATHIPDLVPILAVVAGAMHGAKFHNIARLRLKESDRVASTIAMLSAMGIHAEADDNTLTVHPGAFTGATIHSENDHRIAMSAAIAATAAEGPVTIIGAECVAKSYPKFWEVYKALGGNYEQHIR